MLDANILLRAVLGMRARGLLTSYEDVVAFYSPDICFEEARRYLPELGVKHGFNPTSGLHLLNELAKLVEVVNRTLYEEYEAEARARTASRDAADWPIVATAMLLDCPIWTEDQDFFGTGMATWTSRNIEMYLRRS